MVREQFAVSSEAAASAFAAPAAPAAAAATATSATCAVPSSITIGADAAGDAASELTPTTVLESESNRVTVELVSGEAATVRRVRVEYSGVARFPSCPDGYSMLGRRCVSLTGSGARQECPEGEEVLAVETEAEMDRVESILGMR